MSTDNIESAGDNSDDKPAIPLNAEYVPDAESDDGLILDEQPYQVMKPLDADGYSQLKEGIEKNGILDPIHLTPEGHILDGHHRVLAWREIERDTDGLDASQTPAFVVHSSDGDDTKHITARNDDNREAAAWLCKKAGAATTEPEDVQYFTEKAWELNMQQRHLDDGEKKQAIERRLKQLDAQERRKPDYAVAETLGVSGSWVREVRHRLEGRGNIRTAADITTDTEGRRTAEDAKAKRAAVREAIRDDTTRSNRDIARELDVSHPFVGGVRDEMPEPEPELPERFFDMCVSRENRFYMDELFGGLQIEIIKTVEPEGWWVRLRNVDFYEERDLVGRGLNEAWTIASRTVEREHDAVAVAEEFAKQPNRYFNRKAQQLREEGYEFEHTDLQQDLKRADTGGEA